MENSSDKIFSSLMKKIELLSQKNIAQANPYLIINELIKKRLGIDKNISLFLNESGISFFSKKTYQKIIWTNKPSDIFLIEKNEKTYKLAKLTSKASSLKGKSKVFKFYKTENIKTKPLHSLQISKKLVAELEYQIKILMTAYSLGLIDNLFNSTVNHSNIRKTENTQLIKHKNISHQLVDNLIQISKLRSILTYCHDLAVSKQLNEADFHSTLYLHDQTIEIVIKNCMQIFGAISVKDDFFTSEIIKQSIVLRKILGHKQLHTAKIKLILKNKKSIQKTKIYNSEVF